jgi:hypothetical protein
MTDYKKKAEEIAVSTWSTFKNENGVFDEILIPKIKQALLEAYAEGRKSVLNEVPTDEDIQHQADLNNVKQNRRAEDRMTYLLGFIQGGYWLKQYL